MFQAKVAASSGKGFRDIAAAIIGHDTGHFHMEPLVPGDRGPEVDTSTERFFIGMDLAEWIWLKERREWPSMQTCTYSQPQPPIARPRGGWTGGCARPSRGGQGVQTAQVS